jgi:hypothetical protein
MGEDINGALFSQIKGYFCCDQRRIKLIAELIIGLLKLKQSSMAHWSKALPGDKELDSKYKQIQRFARFFRFSPRLYCQIIWSLYGQGQQVYLTLDRSEWKKRGKWVELVMVGIAYQGMSIPLLWQVYNGRGNTAYATRKALLVCFHNWVKPTQDQRVWWLADREYVGKKWFEALLKRKMHFCIRLPKGAMLTQGNKQMKVHQLFECAHWRVLTKPRKLQGAMLYLAGQRLPDGDYFIVCSASKTPKLAAIYQQRWQIETLFAAFKSRGFNLEDCGLNLARRLKTLIFVLAIAAVWALRTGQWLIKQGKLIPLKQYKDQSKQRWKSLFRWGLDHLQNIALNNLDFKHVIQLCPV